MAVSSLSLWGRRSENPSNNCICKLGVGTGKKRKKEEKR